MQFMKGKTSIKELMDLPNQMVHSLYYLSWQQSLIEEQHAASIDEKIKDQIEDM